VSEEKGEKKKKEKKRKKKKTARCGGGKNLSGSRSTAAETILKAPAG